MNFTDEIKIVGLKRFGDFLAIVRPSYAFMKAQDKKTLWPWLAGSKLSQSCQKHCEVAFEFTNFKLGASQNGGSV